jgi:hypothetical protein
LTQSHASSIAFGLLATFACNQQERGSFGGIFRHAHGTNCSVEFLVPTIAQILLPAFCTPVIEACHFIAFGHVMMQTWPLIFECIVGEALIAAYIQVLSTAVSTARSAEVSIS